MARSRKALGRWRGRVGSQVYSILNGKQVIREAPEFVSNPKTTKQMVTRTKFKFASQFVAGWSPVVEQFYRAKFGKKTTSRNRAFVDVFRNLEQTGDGNINVFNLDLDVFANAANYTTNYLLTKPELVFTEATKTITIANASESNPAVVIYQVRAFSPTGNVVGSGVNIAEITSGTTPLQIVMPSQTGGATRYDIIVYYTQIDLSSFDAAAYTVIQSLIANEEGNVDSVPNVYSIAAILEENNEATSNSQMITGSIVSD